jgi:frataxin-like iron-binding protein CyaY
MDEAAFRTVANATLERIGLALDAALETSNATFEWTLDDGVLTIAGSETQVVVRHDVDARAIVLDAGGRSVAFRVEDGRWVDERTNALGDALVRALRSEARINLRRVPELPAA